MWPLRVDRTVGIPHHRAAAVSAEVALCRRWAQEARGSVDPASASRPGAGAALSPASADVLRRCDMADEMAELARVAITSVVDPHARASLQRDRQLALMATDFGTVQTVMRGHTRSGAETWARLKAARQAAGAVGGGDATDRSTDAVRALAQLARSMDAQAARLLSNLKAATDSYLLISRTDAGRDKSDPAPPAARGPDGESCDAPEAPPVQRPVLQPADPAYAAAMIGSLFGRGARAHAEAGGRAVQPVVLNWGRTVIHEETPRERPRWVVAVGSVPTRLVARAWNADLARGLAALQRLESLLDAAHEDDDRTQTLAILFHAVGGAAEALCPSDRASRASLLDVVVGDSGGSRMARVTSNYAAEGGDELGLWSSLERAGHLLGLGLASAAIYAQLADRDTLRLVSRHVLTRQRSILTWQGRSVFEFYPHGRGTAWVVGLTPGSPGPGSVAGGEGQDAYANSGPVFGFSGRGTVVWNGQEHPYAEDAIASSASASASAEPPIFGILYDYHSANIELLVDGRSCGVAFGLRSRVFAPSVQREQAELIRLHGQLLPVVALLGRTAAPAEPQGGPSAAPGGAAPSSAALSRGRRLANSSSSNSPAGATRTGKAAAAGTVSAEKEGPAAAHSNPLQPPQVSVNFGVLPLAFLPPDCVPLASVEPAQPVADVFAGASCGGSAVMPDASPRSGGDGSGVATDKQQQQHPPEVERVEGFPDGHGNSSAAAAEGAALPDERGRRQQADEGRAAFMQEWSSVLVRHHSWSNFPPQSVRVRVAVSTLQRNARRFVARRRRRRMIMAMISAATKIQAAFRRHKRQWIKKFTPPALCLQSVYRGRQARRSVALCRALHSDFRTVTRAAVVVQKLWRGRRARAEARRRAHALREQLEYAESVVRLVQRLWQVRRNRRQGIAVNRRGLLAVFRLGETLRGIRRRGEALRRQQAAEEERLARVAARRRVRPVRSSSSVLSVGSALADLDRDLARELGDS